MEEDTVGLIDYIRVIWKRKILVIVVTLVCMGVGVVGVVVNSRLKQLPEILYRADTIVQIGQRVTMSPTEPSLVAIEKPADMVAILYIWSEKIIEISGYHFGVKQISTLPMLRLTLEGYDKGVERVLKEIVDMMIDEHKKRADDSVGAYHNYIRKLEADANMIKENIALIEATILEIKSKERKFLTYRDKSMAEPDKELYVDNRSVIWNMLYLKTIDKEIDLSRNQQNLRNIQWQLSAHRTTIGNIGDYNTKMVSEIESTAVKPMMNMEKSAITKIILAGVAGLAFSIILALFIELLEKEKARARVRGKDNSA
jgi:hypothetical protein|tara:strand:- start:99 stop:1037 length:939 start_codon:yes stop_codon:yes gene_type:complete